MLDEPLPADLKWMEGELQSWMAWTPRPEYALRIASAVHDTLQFDRDTAGWKFAVSLAAGVLFWLQLSFYAVSHTNFHLGRVLPSGAMTRYEAPPGADFAERLQDETVGMGGDAWQSEKLFVLPRR